MKYYIYKITCIPQNKVYVGQTKNKRKRIDEHKYDLRHNIHHSVYMQRAFNKYGESNFKFEIIEACNELNVDEKERYWISYYNSTDKNFGFNSESGGNKYKTLSEETKRKIGAKNKIHYPKNKLKLNSKESVIKRSISNTGKKRSDEFRKRMSEIASNRIGENNSFYGKKHSEETKKKISEANKNNHNLGGHKRKKIKAINIETGESSIFESIVEVTKSIPNLGNRNMIANVISGKYKQYKGYTFKELK